MQKWLYDISEHIEALQAVLDEQDDKSITQDVKQALTGIYENDIPAAVFDGISYIKGQEAQIDAIEEEILRLQAVKTARENRLSRVRKGYADFLIAVGKRKIETPRGTMSVPAPTLSTVIDDIDVLPDAYKRTTIKVEADKTSIKQAIQGGRSIPGAHLEERQSIRIK